MSDGFNMIGGRGHQTLVPRFRLHGHLTFLELGLGIAPDLGCQGVAMPCKVTNRSNMVVFVKVSRRFTGCGASRTHAYGTISWMILTESLVDCPMWLYYTVSSIPIKYRVLHELRLNS